MENRPSVYTSTRRVQKSIHGLKGIPTSYPNSGSACRGFPNLRRKGRFVWSSWREIPVFSMLRLEYLFFVFPAGKVDVSRRIVWIRISKIELDILNWEIQGWKQVGFSYIWDRQYTAYFIRRILDVAYTDFTISENCFLSNEQVKTWIFVYSQFRSGIDELEYCSTVQRKYTEYPRWFQSKTIKYGSMEKLYLNINKILADYHSFRANKDTFRSIEAFPKEKEQISMEFFKEKATTIKRYEI